MARYFSAILFMICCLFSENNWAWGHGHFGFYYGAPFWPYYGYPFGYPYPYPYFPPAVVAPPVMNYIQQSPPAGQQNPSAYWHYCTDPEGYYPYIKECPNGWQVIPPTPQN